MSSCSTIRTDSRHQVGEARTAFGVFMRVASARLVDDDAGGFPVRREASR